MKIIIEGKAVNVPNYYPKKSYPVEASGGSKMAHDEYQKHWKNADDNLYHRDPKLAKSGMESVNKLMAYHKANADLFHRMSRVRHLAEGFNQLAEGHKKIHDFMKKTKKRTI